jgi:glyoxalase family protein
MTLRTVDFYTQVLGLRLVKRTVNFDDPGTYHLYYGDELGSPGSLITFFPWPGAVRGHAGGGETAATAYAIPRGASGGWSDRLKRLGVAALGFSRFGDAGLAIEDPDGMRLELIERDATTGARPWRDAGIAVEQAIHGFHSVTLESLRPERTAEVLEGSLGLHAAGEEEGRKRWSTEGAGAPGTIVDVIASAPGRRAELGAGSVHHIAFRATDTLHQLDFQRALMERGLRVTDVADRVYFQSIYFREPGGVLFEVATDPPGMTLDEPLEHLGESLRLPPWYESMRPRLERELPPLTTRPQAARS